MEVYLIRHGQTDWNIQHRYQGHTDIELNDTGREQAREIARSLAGKSIAALYCSDLRRSQETAQIIGNHLHLPVNVDRRWREISFGIWEGKTFNEIYEDYQELYQQWYRNTMDFQVPGGESLLEVVSRAQAALAEITIIHPDVVDKPVAIVTHGGVIRSLLLSFSSRPAQEILWDQVFLPGSAIKLRVGKNNQEFVYAIPNFNSVPNL